MNSLERAICYVAPVYAAKRVRARTQIAAMEAAKSFYDGADTGRRGKSIRRNAAGPNVITGRSLPALRNGSHDLVRNNPHAKRGVEAVASNTIGTGIKPRFKRDQSRATDIDRLARETLDTTDIDADGLHNYSGLQSLAVSTVVESGEALVVRTFDRSRNFPLQFRVLEPEHLDSSRDRTNRNGRIIQGIEFDRKGRRLRYWIFPERPDGSGIRAPVSVPVPARDVLHIYRVDRPGQVRGIPWLAPVMLRVSDFDDYENAQLVRQKIAACFAVFYLDTMGGETPKDDTPEKVEPGMIQRLGPGSEVKFGTPPTVTDYAEYSKVSLRSIAAGLGITYEALTGDLEGVNFTSGRMGRLEMQANVKRWQKLTFIPQMCAPMMKWWLEMLDLTGVDVESVTAQHTPPPISMISPEREVPANVRAMRSGQTTLSELSAQRGRDIDEVIDELSDEYELLDENGIVLDSDPRRVSASGVMQAGGPGTIDDKVDDDD